jgi:hypothetical protein
MSMEEITAMYCEHCGAEQADRDTETVKALQLMTAILERLNDSSTFGGTVGNMGRIARLIEIQPSSKEAFRYAWKAKHGEEMSDQLADFLHFAIYSVHFYKIIADKYYPTDLEAPPAESNVTP